MLVNQTHHDHRPALGVRRWSALTAGALGLLLTGTAAAQQVQFSIDSSSASIAPPITAGSILVPPGGVPALGPLGAPVVVVPPGSIGLMPPQWDLDALSHAKDAKFDVSVPFSPGKIWFSVDRRSHGRLFPTLGPSVRSEIFPPYAAREACQDVFVNLDPVTAMTAPPGFGRHVGVLDGDGLPSLTSGFAYPGLGLLEPGPQDNLDALDILQPGPTIVFFSLTEGAAAAHGYVSGDVLWADSAAAVAVLNLYATANQLGLDLVAGPNTDNLDALMLWENGDGIFSPLPNGWNGWGHGDGNDRLLFSVARNSAVIGQLDSCLGIPIAAGDILMPPAMGFGPLPGIFIRAEQLGLRSGRSSAYEHAPDDLVALDIAPEAAAPLFDCNGNGVEDAVDIAEGTEPDADKNGLPDTCGPAPIR